MAFIFCFKEKEMKIRRTINGETVEIELTYDELRHAKDEFNFENEKADLFDVADSAGVKVPEDKVEDILIYARHLRQKNEYYMDGYWSSLKDSLYFTLDNEDEK